MHDAIVGQARVKDPKTQKFTLDQEKSQLIKFKFSTPTLAKETFKEWELQNPEGQWKMRKQIIDWVVWKKEWTTSKQMSNKRQQEPMEEQEFKIWGTNVKGCFALPPVQPCSHIHSPYPHLAPGP